MKTSVYRLDSIHDDPRFEGFAYNEYRADPFVSKLPNGGWEAPRRAGVWKPTGVRGRVRSFNDFPCLMTDPAFSTRAIEALRDMLEPNGEIIPFESPAGTYYAYNITTVLDCLDLDRSIIKYFPSNARKVLRIFRYEFIPDDVVGRTIFRIRQRPRESYVTSAFVDRVRERGLHGFAFYKVWPLAPNTDWTVLAADERRRLATEGLPEGESIKGNTVRIEFGLEGDAPTDEERRRLDHLAREVDELLVDMTSAAPQVGSLDAVTEVDGTCHFILSCPNADSLFAKLRPWIREVRWPAGCRVALRYGNADDDSAPEVDIPTDP